MMKLTADWIYLIMILGLVIAWGFGYFRGYGDGKKQNSDKAREKGYRECLFVWHEEILDWQKRRMKQGLLSSRDKAYHEDFLTIDNEFIDGNMF